MRILLTTDMYKPTINGVITSTTTLKKALEARGHDVRVLTLGKKSRIDVSEDTYYFSSLGVEKIYPGARFTIKSDHDYLKDIIAWQPEVVHSQTEFSTLYIAKKISKHLDIPIIHTYHTLYEDYTHYFSPSEVVGKKVVKSISRMLLNTMDVVIAPTEKVGNLLEGYHIDTPVSVIPTGIELSHFFNHTYDDIRQKQLRNELGIPTDVKVLLYVGRLAREKNIGEILTYLGQIKPEVDYRFVIVGDGPYRETLQNMVIKNNLVERVVFTGMIENEKIADYYKLGDVFTSASTSETQGLTYIEAFASHSPGLCRHDEVLSHILQNGVTGYQYNNRDEFEQYFNELMQNDNLRENLGENAQQLAIETYSSHKFGELVESVYQKAIEERFVYANN